jgi:hypothetical protein
METLGWTLQKVKLLSLLLLLLLSLDVEEAVAEDHKHAQVLYMGGPMVSTQIGL